ncbi:MAG: hypothetical protein MZV49_25245 [Rhodopseudomonas palustris]|nr:hypothetical protein [Rhodopseudomonas palustris]
MVENTCVGCHMGESAAHGFEPNLACCVACHADAESLDVNGAVTAFEEKVAELKAALVAKGLMNEDGSNVLKNADDTPVQLDPKPAAALFVYHLIEEDGSEGSHNPNYFNALVDAALAALAEVISSARTDITAMGKTGRQAPPSAPSSFCYVIATCGKQSPCRQ